MKNVYLIRGLPSSGKSTFASTLSESLNAPMFEADMHFMKNGKYVFDVKELGTAHERCQLNFIMAMLREEPNIVVSNTFTTEKELDFYVTRAKKNDYRVTTLIVETRHDNKNDHNVPEKTVQKMKQRFSIKL